MRFDIRHGHVLTKLREMPDESVHCVVTSPPYFGLRDYKLPPSVWGDGWIGCLGLEPSPEMYIAHLTEVFREVRRVLRSDGTCWINIGDSYCGYHGNKNSVIPTSATNGWTNGTNENLRARTVGTNGLKSKDLIGIPWSLAFALRTDGWYLRQDIIWHKPNPMPESVRDRCTKAHEYLFLLTKSARYSFDCDAIAEASTGRPAGNKSHKGKTAYESGDKLMRISVGLCNTTVKETRNKRSVWTMTTTPTPEAHFATFPMELPETCIRAGCPPDGLVLDPFSGAGTTGLAAVLNERRYIGLELNPEYIDISHKRLWRLCPLFA